MTDSGLHEKLSGLFGSYKAEWLQESLFDLYSEPLYFPELATPRPCALIGGRGTGKTTVLRSLSFSGQWEILKRHEADMSARRKVAKGWKYFGFYYRVNTARVAAFQGKELEKDEWQRLFLHYINAIFAQSLLKFLDWYVLEIDSDFLIEPTLMRRISQHLAFQEVDSVTDALDKISDLLIAIESYINNIGLDPKPRVSSAGTLESIFSLVGSLPEFKGKTFFLIIDEYENFRDEQQQVINTLIKHTSTSFTFKIGARRLGWRVRNTLNENENLTSPADYVLIDIAAKLDEREFSDFAASICDSRISRLFDGSNKSEPRHVRDLFKPLSYDQEADLLGVAKKAKSLRLLLRKEKSPSLEADQLSDLNLYVMKYLSDGQNEPFVKTFQSYLRDKETWSYRFDEYAFAALFTIHKSKPGIKKYYAGWDVFSRISGINIRYLLELVEQSLLLHLKESADFSLPISPKTQTLAAQAVGKRNLEELAGLSIHGARLTKLVLGLGRIFSVLAEDFAGHTNEVNQFRIRARSKWDETEDWLANLSTPASALIDAAVMHATLIPFPANKPKDEGDTKDNIYQLHPIFAAYFVFSHRKRRDFVLTEDQIIGLVERPGATIRSILLDNNRAASSDVPEQLKLFQFYFDQE